MAFPQQQLARQCQSVELFHIGVRHRLDRLRETDQSARRIVLTRTAIFSATQSGVNRREMMARLALRPQ